MTYEAFFILALIAAPVLLALISNSKPELRPVRVRRDNVRRNRR